MICILIYVFICLLFKTILTLDILWTSHIHSLLFNVFYFYFQSPWTLLALTATMFKPTLLLQINLQCTSASSAPRHQTSMSPSTSSLWHHCSICPSAIPAPQVHLLLDTKPRCSPQSTWSMAALLHLLLKSTFFLTPQLHLLVSCICSHCSTCYQVCCWWHHLFFSPQILAWYTCVVERGKPEVTSRQFSRCLHLDAVLPFYSGPSVKFQQVDCSWAKQPDCGQMFRFGQL